MDLYFAPVQGHTDAAYRHFHSKWYGGDLTYYTPFIRLEKNHLRPRDLKEWKSELNEGLHLVPQIIFRDENELYRLTELMLQYGADEIDLNLGCPFPLQTGHGRGAATIANLCLVGQIKNLIDSNSEIKFSVKTRLGLADKEEWKDMLAIFNETNLQHITLHPRTGRQQYGGETDLQQFERFLSSSKNPVVYNGDIASPEDIRRIKDLFPSLKGIMSGRGILGRPSLFADYLHDGGESPEERLTKMIGFHNDLLRHYSTVLCGDSQVISKIQPFWEYTEKEIGRKAWKAIRKAGSFAKYQTAVAMVQNL